MGLHESDMEWPSMDAISSLLLAKHVSFYLSLRIVFKEIKKFKQKTLYISLSVVSSVFWWWWWGLEHKAIWQQPSYC